MPESRNKPMGIEERTMINLEFVREVFDSSPVKAEAPVHIVTQIVNSLLGMLILPYERRYALFNDEEPLKQLYADGWPKWNITKFPPNEPQTLGKLAWHLRNAASHGLYHFSSNSREPHEVTITVKDKPIGKPINWRASIRADELYNFCQCLTNYMANSSQLEASSNR